jgi:hypothetical protein
MDSWHKFFENNKKRMVPDKTETAPADNRKENKEIAANPNPRANENIPSSAEEEKKVPVGNTDAVGSEITDGEDA